MAAFPGAVSSRWICLSAPVETMTDGAGVVVVLASFSSLRGLCQDSTDAARILDDVEVWTMIGLDGAGRLSVFQLYMFSGCYMGRNMGRCPARTRNDQDSPGTLQRSVSLLSLPYRSKFALWSNALFSSSKLWMVQLMVSSPEVCPTSGGKLASRMKAWSVSEKSFVRRKRATRALVSASTVVVGAMVTESRRR